ncbi:hypothetical protein BDP55DRAFT_632739 [Colletotrichum godetiae]|uniref:Uncharacterized protein n=1 Tax=Colletotrichum godetiae TaxID=1209918 RepID=A0AAJ0AJY7_9PEZI|nr:uncharacterized protein BDP55DRAFT_632739 [Colletotrichum godetiae]KAK1674669.1 hypothetical protein BDP55DRAFT_632739 [Colletotrichum godetiae]
MPANANYDADTQCQSNSTSPCKCIVLTLTAQCVQGKRYLGKFDMESWIPWQLPGVDAPAILGTAAHLPYGLNAAVAELTGSILPTSRKFVVLAPSRLHLLVTIRGSDISMWHGLHSNSHKSHFLLPLPLLYRAALIPAVHYPETPWSTSPATRRQRCSQQTTPPAVTQNALAEIPGFHHLKSGLLSFPLQGSSQFCRVSGQSLRAVPHQTPSNWPSDGQLFDQFNLHPMILHGIVPDHRPILPRKFLALSNVRSLFPRDTATGASNGSHPAPKLPSDINLLGLASSAK